MKTILELVAPIGGLRSVGTRRTGFSPRLPDTILIGFALGAFLVCSALGVLVAFLVIESLVGLLDEGSLLLVFVLLGGTALVLAVPTIAKEAVSWLFSRVVY
jgi:hypothetical protein